MITKSETKTLILSFADNAGKKVNYTLQRPKADLDKESVDKAVADILNAKVFATETGDLSSLQERRIVPRKVEDFAEARGRICSSFEKRASCNERSDYSCKPIGIRQRVSVMHAAVVLNRKNDFSLDIHP